MSFLCTNTSWSSHHTQNKIQILYQARPTQSSLIQLQSSPASVCYLGASFLFPKHLLALPASVPLLLLVPLLGSTAYFCGELYLMFQLTGLTSATFLEFYPQVTRQVCLSVSSALFTSFLVLIYKQSLLLSYLLSAHPTPIIKYFAFVYTPFPAQAYCFIQSKPLINIG